MPETSRRLQIPVERLANGNAKRCWSEGQVRLYYKDKYEFMASGAARKIPAARTNRLEAGRLKKYQPRMWTALKLRITWPPVVGRPKLSIGRKREKMSIWSS